jgi:hypothetical protein
LTMSTRKRIRISEYQLSLIWQQLLGMELTTEEGDQLKMMYPGRLNNDNGPDFRDAVIVNNSDLVKGDVEIHIKSSDWHNHGHHCDPEYNSVILHVVAQHDANSATLTKSGKSVPVARLPRELWHQTYLIPYYQLPCFQIAKHKDKQTLWKLLDIAGEQRFRRKSTIFQDSLQRGNGGQVLLQGMMRALGYSKNSKPFEELARRVPLNFIESMKPRGDLSLKQAWLLGMAGLLPCQREGGEFSLGSGVRELEQIWRVVGKEAESMTENDWHLSHVYPNNSPVRRIVAQSYLLQRYCGGGLLKEVLQLVRKAPMIAGYRLLEDGLIVFADGYWQDHFDFNVRSRTIKSALLGRGKAAEMIVNVVLPFAFAWGEIADEPGLKEKAIELYCYYPKLAENEITHHMARQLCLNTAALTACRQQGLIHIFRNYCREGNCAQCSLAN